MILDGYFVLDEHVGTQRSCSEHGKSQNNGLVTGGLFFAFPRVVPVMTAVFQAESFLDLFETKLTHSLQARLKPLME